MVLMTNTNTRVTIIYPNLVYWYKGGRAAGILFKNIAGNQSFQFDSNWKAYVEAFTNLAQKEW